MTLKRQGKTLDVDKLNFDRCEDEPIHIPELIQGFGYLVAVDDLEDGTISIVSDNVEELLDAGDAREIVGTNLHDLLDGDADMLRFMRDTYRRARDAGTRLPTEVKFRSGVLKNEANRDVQAIIYDSGGKAVIELEPAAAFRESLDACQRARLYNLEMALRFDDYQNVDEMAVEMVNTIRHLTQMDRVILYRFDPDGNGTVVAESKVNDVDSYLGVRYPATDIPQQARALYKKNWVRITPDVDLEQAPLLPAMQEGGRPPLDLTHSMLRSLSPIHTQYVRNQGLRASMSMSLVIQGDLWGLISCHHRQTRYVPQYIRLECENLCQSFSWHLFAKEEQLLVSRQLQTYEAIERMLHEITMDKAMPDVFRDNQRAVLEIMGADGFWFQYGDDVTSFGQTPNMESVQAIRAEAGRDGDTPFLTSDASPIVFDTKAMNGVRGVLLVPLLQREKYFIAWFRNEKPHVEKWVGRPDERRGAASRRDRLQPRTSFEVHEEWITGQSEPWSEIDVTVADRFNRLFMVHSLQTQERLRESMHRMEDLDRHKNEFLATLAHELRNPLAPISTGISVLEREGDAGHRVLPMMKRQLQHIIKLVNDLLDVARISEGKIRLDLTELPIAEVLIEARDTVEDLIRERGHHLDAQLPNDHVMVYGDSTRLVQVFVNILANAVKFTPPGGQIKVQVACDEVAVKVRIKDSGIGIPPEKINLVFDMFAQMDANGRGGGGGLGIGLTLVERLVRLHGGTVIARSEGEGKGTEFEVALPRARAGRSRREALPLNTSRRRHLGRVLVVDDDDDIRHMYQFLLQTIGYDTAVAASGEEALEEVRRFEPDFALLDIGLPDIDGYELARRIASLPGGARTVLFSQSGWGTGEDREKSLAAGCVEHFVKPLDADVLEEALMRYTRNPRT